MSKEQDADAIQNTIDELSSLRHDLSRRSQTTSPVIKAAVVDIDECIEKLEDALSEISRTRFSVSFEFFTSIFDKDHADALAKEIMIKLTQNTEDEIEDIEVTPCDDMPTRRSRTT